MIETNSKNVLNIPIKFPKRESEFERTLQQRVDQYFVDRGKTTKGDWRLYLKTFLGFGLFASSYLLCMSGWLDQWGMLACAIAFGISLAFIAFNIGHDAAHDAYSNNRTLNHVLSYSLNLIGVNRYIWNIKHNLSHHNFTNIPYADMDNENVGVARLTRFHEKKFIYRFQHIYLPMLWLFFSVYLTMVKDFQLFTSPRMGNNVFAKHPPREWIIMIVSKIYFIALTLVVPFLVIDLPFWKILLGIVVMHMTTSLLLASIFFFVHLLDDSPFPEEDSQGKMPHSWVIHQLEVTSDFAPDNRWLSWFAGGLNLHVAHHIYPTMCHVHYPDITRIIRETAEEYGFEYRQKSFREAMVSHLRFLRRMANECKPVPAIDF